MLKVRHFSSRRRLEAAAVRLLADTARAPVRAKHPTAIMLSGGRTPLPVFARLATGHTRPAAGLRVLFSDERMVSPHSPESNYGQARRLLSAWRLAPGRILRVHTHLSPAAAAARYDRELRAFLRRGGRVTLGLLGLGTDGHTASLFSTADVRRAGRRLALATRHPAGGPRRVSVGPALLAQTERIVMLAPGAEKREVIRRLLIHPARTAAGRALRGHPCVEIWTA